MVGLATLLCWLERESSGAILGQLSSLTLHNRRVLCWAGAELVIRQCCNRDHGGNWELEGQRTRPEGRRERRGKRRREQEAKRTSIEGTSRNKTHRAAARGKEREAKRARTVAAADWGRR